MIRYIFKRLLSGLITLWFIATVTFFAMHAVPGNPLLSEKSLSPEIRENLNAKYGLDKPILYQYGIFLSNIVQGDLGISFTQRNRTVNSIIAEHFPISALLGIFALVFAMVGGIILGAIASIYHNSLIDRTSMLISILGVSIPSFVAALLVQIGIVNLNAWFGFSVLPVAGWSGITHLIAPSFVLGLGVLAFTMRLMRSSMLEVIGQNYILAARSRGLSTTRIFFKHQLRNAILPVITIMGPVIAAVTTGGFVVEQVFAIPGLGIYFIQAVQQLDYTLIMGTTVFYGAFLVIMVILVDILYGFVDPRVRVCK